MSKDAWRAAATTDVLFPDDLAGYGPIAVTGPPIPADEAETDTVDYGTLAALSAEHDEEYLVCPQQVRSLIADAWRDDEERAVFEVLETEKGPGDSDPWQIDGRVVENGDPL